MSFLYTQADILIDLAEQTLYLPKHQKFYVISSGVNGIGETEKGLEEIGDKMGLTRERVRQIREKSITKLRDSGNVKILMKYLG